MEPINFNSYSPSYDARAAIDTATEKTNAITDSFGDVFTSALNMGNSPQSQYVRQLSKIAEAFYKWNAMNELREEHRIAYLGENNKAVGAESRKLSATA